MDAMSPFHCPHKALSHEFMSSLGTADQSKQAERCRGAHLRLLAFSREISTLHGMAFLSLAISGLLLLQTKMTIPTDWGKQGAGRTPTRLPAWRRGFGVCWGRVEGAFRWGARSRMVV